VLLITDARSLADPYSEMFYSKGAIVTIRILVVLLGLSSTSEGVTLSLSKEVEMMMQENGLP
jgi:hypothetical protein